MDSKRRRRKQQESRSSPSSYRRKRSQSQTKNKKLTPKSKPKTRIQKKVSPKQTKKFSNKKVRVRSKSKSYQDVQLNVKDGWIKFLILLFITANIFLIYNLIKQWSVPEILQKDAVSKKNTIYQENQEKKKVVDSAPLQIEVLNGCGVSGIAAEFTEYLRQQGFDVVKTDNYESFNILETVIIDRRGRTEKIKKIAKSLGLNNSRILKEVNEAYLIDATVILGKDYRQISSWNKMEHDGYQR